MSVETERVDKLLQTSEDLLHETNELLDRLRTKSDRLIREAGEITAKIHSLAPSPDGESSR